MKIQPEKLQEPRRLHLKLLACEVLCRELSCALARAIHTTDPEFLPQGLHNRPRRKMRDLLQQAVDRASSERLYDAILLGYGLCGHGLAGLRAPRCPLVLPRVHDCIALFFGSRERYLSYFEQNPGTYYLTSGWLERSLNLSPQLTPGSLPMSSASELEPAEVCDHDLLRNYRQIAFIEMGTEPDDRFERQARLLAQRYGLRFEKIRGDLSLIHQLLNGPWEPHLFLQVPPGAQIQPAYDDLVVTLEEGS